MTGTLVAVRGTGSIGGRHLRVFKEVTGLSPIAIPVRAERSAELEARGYGVAKSFAEAAARGVTLAVVATDTSRHESDAEEALAAGMHVLVEKPLAANARRLGELKGRAAKVNRQIHVACNLRFNAGLQRFRERLSDLGPLHAVRIECQSYLPSWRPHEDHRRGYSARAAEGGVLRDLVHEIDYAVWLYGRPADVFCRLSSTGRLEIASEEGADLLWSVDAGPIVSVRLDYLTRTSHRRMVAFGAEGELEWDAVGEWVELRRPGAPPDRETLKEPRDEMMAAQARAFLCAGQGRTGSYLATFDEAAFVVALCDAARASSESGRREPISPGCDAP